MPKRLIKRLFPNPDKFRAHPSLRWLGPMVHDPNLWQFNRKSVALAVAVGAFFAFMLPIAQFLAAAIVAVFLRVNLPVAMTSTLITNPFTFGPWYYLAYQIGAVLVGSNTGADASALEAQAYQIQSVLDSLLGMGLPLVVGLSVLAVGTALAGYALVNLFWRLPALLRLWRRHYLPRR